MKLYEITAKDFYAGFDPGTEEEFSLHPGQSREVSEEKVAQLKRDFEGAFEFSDDCDDVDAAEHPEPGDENVAQAAGDVLTEERKRERIGRSAGAKQEPEPEPTYVVSFAGGPLSDTAGLTTENLEDPIVVEGGEYRYLENGADGDVVFEYRHAVHFLGGPLHDEDGFVENLDQVVEAEGGEYKRAEDQEDAGAVFEFHADEPAAGDKPPVKTNPPAPKAKAPARKSASKPAAKRGRGRRGRAAGAKG